MPRQTSGTPRASRHRGLAAIAGVVVGLVATGYRLGRRISPAGHRNRILGALLGRPPEKIRKRPVFSIFRFADLLLALLQRLERHAVFSIAAEVAFYTFLAIFPALAAFAFFYALIGDPARLVSAVAGMAFILPGDVAGILAEHAQRLTTLAGTSVGAAGLVSFALVVFSASSGLMALCDGLNIAFERVETRSLVGRRARAIVLTLAAILFITLVLVILDRLQAAAAAAGIAPAVVGALRWPLTVIVAAMALATLYHYGPDRTGLRWRFFTAGSITAAILWVAASHALAWYLANFPGFGLTYGSLAALAGFLFWVWLSTIVAVIGAELDAILEHDR